MCNDPIDSFHYRFTTTSRDVACFIHNKEHAFESGPSDRKQNGGAFFFQPRLVGWIEPSVVVVCDFVHFSCGIDVEGHKMFYKHIWSPQT